MYIENLKIELCSLLGFIKDKIIRDIIEVRMKKLPTFIGGNLTLNHKIVNVIPLYYKL